MSTPILGEQLIDLCRSAKKDIFIAAPFIKHDSLKRIVAAFPINVTNIKIVTRWIPEEIAAGVCDLEIFELLQGKSIDLFIHPALHAKLYRVDENCLLGSANITNRALGWSWQPNIELMVNASASNENIANLEKKLLFESIKVTQNLHDEIEIQVKQLMSNELSDIPKNTLPEKWLPSCLKPELLYKIYSNIDTSKSVQSLVECGKDDLLHLRLPNGLNESEFKKYISLILEHHPLIIQINQTTSTGSLNTEELIKLLISYCQPNYRLQYEPIDHWYILKAWLFYFFQNRYRVKVVNEIFEQSRLV